MPNKQLFEQVERHLERKLTPEECEFLVLAVKKSSQKKRPQEAEKPKSRVA